jgi:hypothetical protein
MIRAKTVSSASLAISSRHSKAGNGGACREAEKRACFAGPLLSLRRSSSTAHALSALRPARTYGHLHPRAAARLVPDLLKSP